MKFAVNSLILFFIVLAFSATASARSKTENPSYWIKKLKNADAVVMSPEEIEALNTSILSSNPQMASVLGVEGRVIEETLIEWLLYEPIPSPERGYKRYGASGELLPPEFFEDLAANMNIEAVEQFTPVRFAVVTQRADIRAFPTEESALKKPSSNEFDMFQYSSIYPPEAVALLHISGDAQWGFFQTSTVRGWIRLDKVAFTDRASLIPNNMGSALTITGSKVEVFGDESLQNSVGALPMGAVINLKTGPQEKKDKRPWVVAYPKRNADGTLSWSDGYIPKRADVSTGRLSYTRRNVIKQAFKMLGEEYGWGGKDGRRDCSEFIKDLFATMGLKLPRNSGQQARSGDIKALSGGLDTPVDVKGALKKADPGVTLLAMPGHIMLHIGERKGKPYVIHQVFGYMEGKKLKILNKVSVTGLDAGKRSKGGALKNRIKGVTELVKPVDFESISGMRTKKDKG